MSPDALPLEPWAGRALSLHSHLPQVRRDRPRPQYSRFSVSHSPVPAAVSPTLATGGQVLVFWQSSRSPFLQCGSHSDFPSFGETKCSQEANREEVQAMPRRASERARELRVTHPHTEGLLRGKEGLCCTHPQEVDLRLRGSSLRT